MLPTLFRGETLPGDWVHVVTQLEERIAHDGFTGHQSQPLRSLTNPPAGLGLSLCVVIVVRQVLVEISRRSGSVLLWFGREQQRSQATRTRAQYHLRIFGSDCETKEHHRITRMCMEERNREPQR